MMSNSRKDSYRVLFEILGLLDEVEAIYREFFHPHLMNIHRIHALQENIRTEIGLIKGDEHCSISGEIGVCNHE